MIRKIGSLLIASSLALSGAALGSTSVVAAPNTTKSITWKAVKSKSSPAACWTVINGKVYNVTDWVTKHPGGAARIAGLCGTNGTRLFTGQHGGQMAPESVLKDYQIGVIKTKKKKRN